MKNLNEMNLTELSSLEQRDFQGGDTYVYYTDTKGYVWTYRYDNADNLVGVCVTKTMAIM